VRFSTRILKEDFKTPEVFSSYPATIYFSSDPLNSHEKPGNVST
jgi:hypothetical protein